MGNEKVLMGDGQKLTDSVITGLFGGKTATLVIRVLVGLLIMSLSLWMISGIVYVLSDLISITESGWEDKTEHVIVNTVIMLAILELLRTLQSYMELGRVRVTFIIDAALVVLVGELISLWYREYTTMEVVLSLSVIVVLTILRITTMKFSPDC